MITKETNIHSLFDVKYHFPGTSPTLGNKFRKVKFKAYNNFIYIGG